MNSNNFIPLIGDPLLPELLPEGPVLDQMFPLDDLMMFPSQPEITDLSRKFDSLTVDTNTHGLRIQIERSKRQRLQTTVRQLRHDLATANADITILKNEITQLREHQNSINFQLDSENARTNTLSFRSLSRIGQILTLDLNRTQLAENDPEMATLLHELNHTIRQFGVYYSASYAECHI